MQTVIYVIKFTCFLWQWTLFDVWFMVQQIISIVHRKKPQLKVKWKNHWIIRYIDTLLTDLVSYKSINFSFYLFASVFMLISPVGNKEM